MKYFVHSIANFYFPYISSFKIRQAIGREQVAMHKTDDGGQLIMLDKLSGEKAQKRCLYVFHMIIIDE